VNNDLERIWKEMVVAVGAIPEFSPKKITYL
jgi:hypothetical protein